MVLGIRTLVAAGSLIALVSVATTVTVMREVTPACPSQTAATKAAIEAARGAAKALDQMTTVSRTPVIKP
jgi:hypothetical protein